MLFCLYLAIIIAFEYPVTIYIEKKIYLKYNFSLQEGVEIYKTRPKMTGDMFPTIFLEY